jgi:hypothetical protein
MSGGADAQIGFKSETTPGTLVVVDQFPPFKSEGLAQVINYLDTETISARHTLSVTKQGTKEVGGPVSFELANVDLATLLTHMMGTVVTTGAGPYEHVATPGSLVGKSMSWQVGRPSSDGTVNPFDYAGCKVGSWTISADVGSIATMDLDLVGMTEATDGSLATASYDTAWEPFVFTEASLTLAGSAIGTVRSLSVTGDNAIERRVRLGSGTSKEPLQIGRRPYTGTVSMDFDGLTEYAKYVAGTQVALVALFDNGTDTLTITANVQYTGDTPTVGGQELLEQTLPFRCLSATSDATAITLTLSNTEVLAD